MSGWAFAGLHQTSTGNEKSGLSHVLVVGEGPGGRHRVRIPPGVLGEEPWAQGLVIIPRSYSIPAKS